MSKQIINVGQSANDRSGDPLRNAFEKVNSNFTELYSAIVDGVSFDQVNSDWNAVSGVARILNKPIIPTNTNQLTNGAGFITGTDRIVNGAKEVILDANGSITVPYPSQDSFRIRLDSANFVPRLGKATLTLTGTAWDFYGAFANSQDGQRELIADSGPLPSIVNPGYEDGDTFEIDSTAHGVVGFILTVILNDVVQAGPAGWTANLAFSPPPEYTSTVKSLGAVKLTANTNSLVLGTDGTVTVSGAIKQGNSKLHLNVDGGTNVYLTPTTDDSTAVFVNQTSVQAYATESISLQVGAGLSELELLWTEAETLWVEVRDQDAADIAPATRAWAGLPSYQAYDIILNTFPVEPAAPGNLVPVANNAKNAYNFWQATLGDTSVGISVGNNNWTFAPSGTLTLPEPANINFNDPSIRFGGATSVATNNYGFGVPGPAAGVVYTATQTNLASMKLLVTIEGQEDGGDGLYHTQVCEMLVVRRTGLTVDIVDSVVYGVLHTSLAPLATLTTQLSVDGRVEILAQPTNTTAIYVKVHATEVVRGD